jgi:hypothetical protein
MGAWGAGSFQNDDALDWIGVAFEDGGALAVAGMLRLVTQLPDDAYLEVDIASAAVAAAAIAAAARDGDLSTLPEDLRDTVSRDRQSLSSPALIASAKTAVARVLQSSELQELWADSGSQEWFSEMNNLLARLR